MRQVHELRYIVTLVNLQNKIILYAIAPLLLALFAIAYTVYYQATVLGQLQHATIEKAYRATRDTELKNYVALAEQSIAHLYDSGRKDAAAIKEAKAILAGLNYGPDGYFFLFNLDGEVLMHARQPELVGKNLWDLRDDNGDPAIQKLVSRAIKGGGFEDYMWRKPSSQRSVSERKRAYVVVLKDWNWVLGTGIYLDDVDAALAKVDSQVSANIFDTMLWIVVIAFLSVAAIVWGLMLNIRKRDEADAKLGVAEKKLRGLAQRFIHAQEEERSRIGSDLHDGIKPMLVVIKMKVEVGIERLHGKIRQAFPPQNVFKEATDLVMDTLEKLDRVIRDIIPIDIERLGLVEAMNRLAVNMRRGSTAIEFSAIGEIEHLPITFKTSLFRVAQTALHNVVRHAAAANVAVQLKCDSREARLTIEDDGRGFDVDRVRGDPDRGFGLRNMELRAEAVGGRLEIKSSSSGTIVLAIIPLT